MLVGDGRKRDLKPERKQTRNGNSMAIRPCPEKRKDGLLMPLDGSGSIRCKAAVRNTIAITRRRTSCSCLRDLNSSTSLKRTHSFH